MKRMSVFSLLALCAALSGCDQKTKINDGIVPNELLPYVQKFVGTYRGQFERQASGMTVTVDGNRLVLTSATDFISPACQSKIGKLLEVYTEEKDHIMTITRAVFAFDPNLCANDIVGRELYVSVAKQAPITLNVEYLDHYEEREVCDVNSTPISHGPIQNCHWEPTAWYSGGRFIKN